jgi:hypothetical protein
MSLTWPLIGCPAEAHVRECINSYGISGFCDLVPCTDLVPMVCLSAWIVSCKCHILLEKRGVVICGGLPSENDNQYKRWPIVAYNAVVITRSAMPSACNSAITLIIIVIIIHLTITCVINALQLRKLHQTKNMR